MVYVEGLLIKSKPNIYGSLENSFYSWSVIRYYIIGLNFSCLRLGMGRVRIAEVSNAPILDTYSWFETRFSPMDSVIQIAFRNSQMCGSNRQDSNPKTKFGDWIISQESMFFCTSTLFHFPLEDFCFRLFCVLLELLSFIGASSYNLLVISFLRSNYWFIYWRTPWSYSNSLISTPFYTNNWVLSFTLTNE